MNRHALKIIAKEIKKGEIIRITSDEDTFSQLVQYIVHFKAIEALDDSFAKGYLPSQQEIQTEIQSATEKLLRRDMFFELVKDIIAEELETDFYITNDEINVSVMIQNLMTMLQLAPKYADQIIQQTTDLMGLSPFRQPTPQMGQQPQQGQPAPQQGPQAPTPSPIQPPLPNGQGAGLTALGGK
jgi:hypothetical protein